MADLSGFFELAGLVELFLFASYCEFVEFVEFVEFADSVEFVEFVEFIVSCVLVLVEPLK